MGENFTKKELIVILLIVAGLIFAVGFKFLPKGIFSNQSNPVTKDGLTNPDYLERGNQEPEVVEAQDEIIMIHISGQVYKPGLVELKLGQRLIDAVDLAGGLKENADLDRINLAKKLSDEDKIYIPALGEELVADILYDNNSSETGKININKCDKAQLLTLPGIGEVIATRIMDYRRKTPFTCVEDLLNVSGIGEKKFEEIKDLVNIN